ncbi:DEAD/DEAH box helicase [Anaerosporobacter faecicola]|uniref:DEAD/DEAH box helicase n=1 Tax=Anaerosporobacter faecicola TaxID=2718714 RepID=UPI001EE5330F|nr:DEAD/DEAH box helicase [Anaerosporobacter faecicola]
MNFKELVKENKLVKALEIEKIVEPTKVQELVYPIITEGKDVIAESETGSGKTLAYLVPIFEKYKEIQRTNQVIILVPTHELAMQVHNQVERLSKNSGLGLQSAVIIGNVNITRQIEKLKEKPQIIIGTAGRIHELIKKKKIAAHTVKTIVIDEGDKLLNADNVQGVQEVIKCTMRDRQLLVFSASITNKTLQVAKELMKDPSVIKTQKAQTIPDTIEHICLVVERRDKLETLRKLTRIMKAKRAMIFINKVSEIEEATYKLVYEGLKAECLHGSNVKTDRKRVVEQFRNGKIQYLIATDIAARGLHFDGIDTVFHISIPEDEMEYLHRSGRTGRNGQPGRSVLIVTKEELPLIKKYQKRFGINIVAKKMYQGKLVRG